MLCTISKEESLVLFGRYDIIAFCRQEGIDDNRMYMYNDTALVSYKYYDELIKKLKDYHIEQEFKKAFENELE